MQISFTNCEKEDYKVQQVGELQKAIKVGYKIRWVSNYKVRKKKDFKVQKRLQKVTKWIAKYNRY